MSKSTTSFAPSDFDVPLCDSMVDHFRERFIQRFRINMDSEKHHLLLLEDDLTAAYNENHTFAQAQINAAMFAVYTAHCEILDWNFAPLYEPFDDAEEALNEIAPENLEEAPPEPPPDNLNINANIQPPANDARNARAQNRGVAREQAAAPNAPDGGGGDDDDDDNDANGPGDGDGRQNRNNLPPRPPRFC